MNQVNAGRPFGYRVLDLKPGVHLEEIESARLIRQKLERSGVVVLGCACNLQRRFANCISQFRHDGRKRRRALLDHLLMPPLDGTLALAEMDQMPSLIAQDLNFDVPGLLDQFFEIDLTRPEGVFRLARGTANRLLQISFGYPRGAYPFLRLQPKPSAIPDSRFLAAIFRASSTV